MPYMSLRRNRSKQEIERELDGILNDIAELNLRVQELRKGVIIETDRKFKLGESVRITNKYKGYLDTLGTVIRVTDKFITIKSEKGEELIRAPKNLELVLSE